MDQTTSVAAQARTQAARRPCRQSALPRALQQGRADAPHARRALAPVRTRGHACRRGAKNLVPLRRDPAAHRARGGVSAHLRVLLANASLANKRQNFPSVTFRLPQKHFFAPLLLHPRLVEFNHTKIQAGVGRR